MVSFSAKSLALAVFLSMVSAAPAGDYHIHEKSDVLCPYSNGNTVEIAISSSTTRYVLISYLHRTERDCVYRVHSSEKSPAGELVNLVAKTPRKDFDSFFDTNQIAALGRVRELYGAGEDASGREWLLSLGHTGLPITQTERWISMFQGSNYNTDTNGDAVQECAIFMRSIYSLVAGKQRWYAQNYGWYSGDSNWDSSIKNLRKPTLTTGITPPK